MTGAAGFIGSHLVGRLVKLGCRVTALVRPASGLERLQAVLSSVKLVECDLAAVEAQQLHHWIPEAQVVFHLAAAGVDQARQDTSAIVRTNIMGTLELLQLARTLGVERFVNCGSCFEYGSGSDLAEGRASAPANEYAASKVAAGALAHAFFRQYGLPVVSLRPFTVYGPLEGSRRLVPQVIRKALEGRDIELTGGKQTRDFVFADDAVDAFLAAAVSAEAVGGVFNICSGVETSVRDLVSLIIQLSGTKAKPVFGAIPYRPDELWTQSGNPALAKEKLGWYARVSLEEGLRRSLAWYQQQNPQVPKQGFDGR